MLDFTELSKTGEELELLVREVLFSMGHRVYYKTGAGIEPALLAQFHPMEEALAAMGVVVWPMIPRCISCSIPIDSIQHESRTS